ncbi:MAG: replicative DNA helicase [Minisyncoccia bacterium]
MVKKDELKIPPHDLEAEKSVLGSLMIDQNAIFKIADFLSANDFYDEKHKLIYETIVELIDNGKPIDLLSVKSRLKEKKLLNKIGSTDFLTDLINSVPTAAHIVHYANIVKEKKVRRDLISASSDINEQALEQSLSFEELLDRVEQKIFTISQKSRPQKFSALKEELPLAYERLEKLHSGRSALRGIPTFFTDIDNILSGLQRSELIILGARPSYGKTAFALDIARQVALGGYTVGVFSIEMSKDQIVDRLISAQAQIPLWQLRTGRLSDELEFGLVQKALDELSKTKIFIDDTPSPTIIQIKSMARRLQIENGLDLIVIDYLQLIQPRTDSESMVQQVTEISRGLKSLARELNVPVLAVSQLSRDVDKREIKIPRLSDLRESGSLEQDADVVLFIYRKDKEKIEINTENPNENIAEIIIAKNRNGPLGAVKLKFDAEKVTFYNLEKPIENFDNL